MREVVDASALDSEPSESGAEADWNRLYRQGVGAIADEDLSLARRSFCEALGVARHFEPRDWRFAETLDELGLVGFLGADLEFTEAMQGAAVAEMLLALGPAQEVSVDRPARQRRLSSVKIYAARLAWVHTQLGRPDLAEEATRRPHTVLALGYLPQDSALASRLDWLISQYLLEESFDIADWLADLKSRIETPIR